MKTKYTPFRTIRGSNQFAKRYQEVSLKATPKAYLTVLVFTAVFFWLTGTYVEWVGHNLGVMYQTKIQYLPSEAFSYLQRTFQYKLADAPEKLISPLAQHAYAAEVSPTPTPTEHDLITQEIREVFNASSSAAFKLLSCENGKLNPQAINVNTDGSKDIGVFQISEYWQKTQKKFLLNWKINIQVAYQLFTENHNKFSLWTCGRKLGI